MDTNNMITEIKSQLTDRIIPFWEKLKDEKNGGYYGYLDFDLNLDPGYEKGCILNSRILWFFSNAYLLLKDKALLEHAGHAYEFLNQYCLDQQQGGIFWSVDWDGKPKDTTKHTYNQAFAIYALASYYDASGNDKALQQAKQLFALIETKCRDQNGYGEAYTRDFKPESNEKLSENGVMADKTMNTLLHVMEAYTELYRVTKKEEVAKCLREILDTIEQKVYNQELGRQEVFFDNNWNSLIDLYSYGHDIETAWLVDRCLEMLGDSTYTERLSAITKTITKNIYDRAYVEHSLLNEAENGVVDTTRVWWVQAEAVVGFLNGYQKDPSKTEYLEAAEEIWKYIAEYMVDKREGSEWFWALDAKKNPLPKPIVEPWKCPYHNGRMCMEVIRRLEHDS